MTDPHHIKTVTQLREVIGEEIPGLGEKNTNKIGDDAAAFISKSPFLVLCTADAEGHVDASPKGDAPGFVLIEDNQTLVIPDRPGNKLAYGHLNILSNPRVGILFAIPRTSETLRINGRAELSRDPELLERLAAREKAAVLAIRVHVEECFFHCGKAFIRSKLWDPAAWPDRHRVSFGKMYVKRKGGDDRLAAKIDENIQRDYEQNL